MEFRACAASGSQFRSWVPGLGCSNGQRNAAPERANCLKRLQNLRGNPIGDYSSATPGFRV